MAVKRAAPACSRFIYKTTTFLRQSYAFTSGSCHFQISAAGSALGFQLKASPRSAPLLRPSSTAFRTFSASTVGHRSRMPPKKKEEEKKVLLGRPGNSLKSGIVCRSIPSTVNLNASRNAYNCCRLVWPTLENQHCFKRSPNAHWATQL